MVSLLLVHKRKRLGRKLPFDKFNLVFFPEDRLACFGMQLRSEVFEEFSDSSPTLYHEKYVFKRELYLFINVL